MLLFYLLQVLGEKTRRIGKISSLPANMAKDKTILDRLEKIE